MEKKTSPNSPPAEEIARAADLIRAGELVAFPTETVYGLGANALDARAVRRVFAMKGRPATSPLIVHVSSVAMARSLAAEWPARADELARKYWPGPLTLVLRKTAQIPDEATAGLPTAGLRMPAHPVALALIEAAGVPIAAPSANRFTQLSPTTAEHVREAFGSELKMILDGGPTEVGIESTVISLVDGEPVLLRPGMIALPGIRSEAGPAEGAHASPGQHPKHYSPRTPLLVVENGALPEAGHGVYIGRRETVADKSVHLPENAREYAARIYGVLHELDREKWDWIAVERPPEEPEWAAIQDRLRRAAAR
ncbi:MAG: L-threonylcarbamoyladenylate synthase [Bryobacteraceae bacterium]